MIDSDSNQPNLDDKTLHYKKNTKTTSTTFLGPKNKDKI